MEADDVSDNTRNADLSDSCHKSVSHDDTKVTYCIDESTGQAFSEHLFITEQPDINFENQGPSKTKIINTSSDSVNDLSKSAKKVLNAKDLTLHNIGDENMTLDSKGDFLERNSPSMKPDRSHLHDKKKVLLEKLAKVLKQNSDIETKSIFRGRLLERLRSLHQPDSYHVLPSPDSSTSEEEKREESSGVTGTLLSVIEEAEQQLEDPGSCVELLLSRIESETHPAPLRGSADPCTDCQLCVNIVSPVHKLSVRLPHMGKVEKSSALIGLWREIKTTMKDKHFLESLPKRDCCIPCDLCCDICSTYHEYVRKNSLEKRNQIREDFARIIKKIDPQTQVVMNSYISSDKQLIRSDSFQKLANQGADPTVTRERSSFLENDKSSTGTSRITKSLCDQAETREEDTTAQHQTTEFESPTGESGSSDDLDTSAGVKTIPYYETLSSRSSDCVAESSSKHISEQMRKELIMQINKAISKEVKTLKKELTNRILGTLSPSLSHSDLRSIEKAVVEPDLEQNLVFDRTAYKNRAQQEAPKTSSLYLSPVVLAQNKIQKLSKYDLLKQLPIAEEDKRERKHCLLANMNKPPPKKKTPALQPSRIYMSTEPPSTAKQHFTSTQTSAKVLIKETISSEESPSVTVPAFPIISNSGLIHIQKKGGEKSKKHKIKVSIKSRQRDNTLSNLTFPLDEEVSDITDIPPCLMETMDLSLYSTRQSKSVSSQSSNTVQEKEGPGSVEEATVGSEESRSYCCVCGHWEFDYEADISDHEKEREGVAEDLGTISETEGLLTETAQEANYTSDESGGGTDFTAYTAVIPRKSATKTVPDSKTTSALPKKIKLDLPRSLTKNSPSTFLLRGVKDGALSEETCSGLVSPEMRSKLSENSRSNSKSFSVCSNNKKSLNAKIGSPLKTGKDTYLSMLNNRQKLGINQNLKQSKFEAIGNCPRKLPKKTNIAILSPSLSTSISKENSPVQPGVGNKDNSTLRQTLATKQRKLPSYSKLMPKAESMTNNAQSNPGGIRPKSYPKHNKAQVKSSIQKHNKAQVESAIQKHNKAQVESAIPTPKTLTLKESALKPKIIKSVAQKNSKISKFSGPKPVKISSSASAIPTPKKNTKSNLPLPVKKSASSSNSVMSKTKQNTSSLNKLSSSLANEAEKCLNRPENCNNSRQKTSEKSNSKRSSSFDSGIASSRTKSFRVTQVLNINSSRGGAVSKTPDSMARQMTGRSSPAVSISFPKGRKLPSYS